MTLHQISGPHYFCFALRLAHFLTISYISYPNTIFSSILNPNRPQLSALFSSIPWFSSPRFSHNFKTYFLYLWSVHHSPHPTASTTQRSRCIPHPNTSQNHFHGYMFLSFALYFHPFNSFPYIVTLP